MSFGEPIDTGNGANILPRNVENHLLLIWATDYVHYSPTVNTKEGDRADCVVVDAVDLDQIDEDGNVGLLARNCWWRQTKLIESLKGRVGNPEPLLVRISKGKTTRGIPPFILTSQTSDPQAVSRATNWMKSNDDFTPNGPGGGPEEKPNPWGPSPAQAVQQAAARPANESEMTALERLARQSTQQSPSLPPARPAEDRFPESEIPF